MLVKERYEIWKMNNLSYVILKEHFSIPQFLQKKKFQIDVSFAVFLAYL